MADDQLTIFGYEIHHLFPREIITGMNDARVDAARALLNSINFNIEFRGNKIPLLRNPDTISSINQGPASVVNVLKQAGFGDNWHNSQAAGGNHPGYNDFVLIILSDLNMSAEMGNWGPDSRSRAVFDLHRYLDQIARDGSLPIIGTGADTFRADFESYLTALHGPNGPDYTNLGGTAQNAIDGYRSTGNNGQFDATVTDADGENNTQERYLKTEETIAGARGVLGPEELKNADTNFAKASPSGNSGNATAAGMAA